MDETESGTEEQVVDAQPSQTGEQGVGEQGDVIDAVLAVLREHAAATRAPGSVESEQEAGDRAERELLTALAVRAYGPGAKPRSKPKVMPRIQTLAIITAWAAECVRVTGDRSDRFTVDDALSNFNAWLVMSGADRPALSGSALREELKGVLDRGLHLDWVTSGRYFKGALMD